ncbi:NAD(P)H-dependent oxidoreductase [Alkaliphilus transvaalensis]|uniref:NAD(P)H-dependent oxidoreductase n=1 Tax=Alkaliphilus transvaalensis TaxID=114628 RepID=UPI00047DE59F|nr:NAD(P)H-dependent oxidoreductase [Alkaliphilus transvaalensis]
MKALIIFAHPNTESFNGTILDTIEKTFTEKGEEYITRNLYDTNFNAYLTLDDLIKINNRTLAEDIAIEQMDIKKVETIIFIFPIWWGGPPAILKGWFDRVLTKGFAYSPKVDGSVEGLLSHKKVIVFATSGSSTDTETQKEIFQAIETILIKGTFNFCGITDVSYHNLEAVPSTNNANRNQMLDDVKKIIEKL